MCVAETLKATSILVGPLSVLAAVFSGMCAFFSYRLARKIQNELKSDEQIIAGVAIHPSLRESAHSGSVIQCTLFNKSKRKAYVNAVSVYDRRGTKIDVTWSDDIDEQGNPQKPCQLIGLVDASSLFIRRNDGERVDYARISVAHSFSAIPIEIVFDPAAELL